MRWARGQGRNAASARWSTHLVVADVVVALVCTPPVRSGLERSGNVFDVWDAVNKDRGRPALRTQRCRIEIHCIGWQNKDRDVRQLPIDSDVERRSVRSRVPY